MKKVTRTAILFMFASTVLTACGGGGSTPLELSVAPFAQFQLIENSNCFFEAKIVSLLSINLASQITYNKRHPLKIISDHMVILNNACTGYKAKYNNEILINKGLQFILLR